MSLTETVTLRVVLKCASCARTLDTSETLPGNSVRTGNTSQTARYWLDGMQARVLAAFKARDWRNVDGKDVCAHCNAAIVDPLGNGPL